MSILSDLTGIKNILSDLQSNKVTRIAYDENAYTNNTVASPESYAWEQHNNIPQQTLTAMKMTEQQIEKGFRLRFPILNKYFFNAFFGRVSYNLNKLIDFFYSAVDALVSSLGEPNGLATLDSNGRLPASQVSETLMTYKGGWSPSTNTPHLEDGVGTKGDCYLCEDSGTVTFGTGHTVTFLEGDRAVYNGSVWQKLSAGAVRTVCDILPDGTGNVDLLLQTDVTKLLNPSVLGQLFYWGIGRNWVQGSGTTGFTNFLSVWHANNMWVAGAYSYGGVWWSEDGKSWAQSDTAIISTSRIRSVYFGNNVWVACTDFNGIWWSEDGKNWTQSSTTATQSLSFREVLYKTNMWVAVANGSVWYSTDGKTWTQASGITNSDYYAVTVSNNLWVVGSGSTAGAYWSTDGINWTACTGGITGVYKLYYKNNMFIACTSAGLWWSTDGKAWTQTSTTAIQSYAFYSVYYANGVWVAGTNTHGVWYSTDGKTWTQGSGIGTTESVPFVFYANSIYLAGSTTTGLWISSDGQSWSLVSAEAKFTAGVPFDYGIFQEGMFLLASTAGLYYSDWTTI